MAIALYPGSFDPPTNGHLDIIRRASRHFEKVIIAVVSNPSKKALFESEERIRLLKETLTDLTNVEFVAHEGLTVDLARERAVSVIVKGLRATSDLESELTQAQMNATLLPETDTLFIVTNPKWSFVSSSLIKEVASLGGDVEGMVPPGVNEALKRRFS
ncbi:MAG: pantetheine-phosphate adenylyltransferase [Acidimicrobiia bacterium]